MRKFMLTIIISLCLLLASCDIFDLNEHGIMLDYAYIKLSDEEIELGESVEISLKLEPANANRYRYGYRGDEEFDGTMDIYISVYEYFPSSQPLTYIGTLGHNDVIVYTPEAAGEYCIGYEDNSDYEESGRVKLIVRDPAAVE